MNTRIRSIAIVRPFRPNLAEIAVYRPFLSEFNITFYYTGISESSCRNQLDSLGLQKMSARRYTGYTDVIRSSIVQRGLDYKVGLGSAMLSHVGEVLSHSIINIADPIYLHAWQIVRRIQPSQKLVIMRWENIDGRYEKIFLPAKTAPKVLERADRIVCISEAAYHTLRLSYPSSKASLTYPGIRCDRPFASNNRSGRPVILYTGRAQWSKGLSCLLAAFAILRFNLCSDCELWIIGVGRESINDEIKRLRLGDYVSVFGRIPLHEVEQKMVSSSVFCFPSMVTPSWTEQYGFAMVEAMAHGLPVVAFDSGCNREICGDDGEYASTGNAYSLATALDKVLRSADRGQNRGNRLRARAQEYFDAERQGAELLTLYRSLG